MNIFALKQLEQRISGLLLLLWIGSSIVGTALPSAAQDFEPPDRGLPGRREGGGTRGGCPSQQPSLTAIMPSSNVGRTITAYPSFSWYVPQNSASAAEFVLLDAMNTEVYKTVLPVSNQAGVISLSLPTDGSVAGLEVGKSYRWYFSLICDPLDRSADSFTTGWVERIAPSPTLTQNLARITSEEQAATIYAQAGIWYEAVATLVKLRQLQPQNPALRNQWQALLDSAGLKQVANQPLLPQ